MHRDAVIFRASHLVAEVEQSLWTRTDAAHGMVLAFDNVQTNRRIIFFSIFFPLSPVLPVRWLSARSETIST